MIERACDDDGPFDLIVVHSFSRFFRDAFGLEMYVRKLAKSDVRLVSANASSLLGLSGTLNFGSTEPARRYLRIVFRDNPVRRDISRIEI